MRSTQYDAISDAKGQVAVCHTEREEHRFGGREMERIVARKQFISRS